MRCDGINGYASWSVIDMATGIRIDDVLWVDPETKSYCTMDRPARVTGGRIAKTVHFVEDITEDFTCMTFWVVRGSAVVAPLSQGRQAQQDPEDKPCRECCQEEACRRTGYCAAHRCGFGEQAP